MAAGLTLLSLNPWFVAPPQPDTNRQTNTLRRSLSARKHEQRSHSNSKSHNSHTSNSIASAAAKVHQSAVQHRSKATEKAVTAAQDCHSSHGYRRYLRQRQPIHPTRVHRRKLSHSHSNDTSDAESVEHIHHRHADGDDIAHHTVVYELLTRQRNEAMQQAQRLQQTLKEKDVQFAIKMEQLQKTLARYKHSNAYLRQENRKLLSFDDQVQVQVQPASASAQDVEVAADAPLHCDHERAHEHHRSASTDSTDSTEGSSKSSASASAVSAVPVPDVTRGLTHIRQLATILEHPSRSIALKMMGIADATTDTQGDDEDEVEVNVGDAMAMKETRDQDEDEDDETDDDEDSQDNMSVNVDDIDDDDEHMIVQNCDKEISVDTIEASPAMSYMSNNTLLLHEQISMDQMLLHEGDAHDNANATQTEVQTQTPTPACGQHFVHEMSKPSFSEFIKQKQAHSEEQDIIIDSPIRVGPNQVFTCSMH